MTAGAPTASSGLTAVPWRHLIWVTWRQRRSALTWALIALALTAAVLALTGVTVHHAASEHRYFYLTDQWWGGYDIRLGVALSLVVPMLAGVFLGAPLVAREAETGTAMLAWTQDASRTRWLLAQAAPVAVLLGIVAAALQLEYGWLPGLRAATTAQVPWSPEAFTLHPLPLAGWTALTVSLAVLLGAVIRRTVPALAAAAACAAALYAATALWRAYYLPPLHVADPARFSGGYYSWGTTPRVAWTSGRADDISSAAGLPDGRLLSWAQVAHHTNTWLRLHHLSLWFTYQPGSRYGTFQVIEFGWLTVLSACLIAATVIVIRRRSAVAT